MITILEAMRPRQWLINILLWGITSALIVALGR